MKKQIIIVENGIKKNKDMSLEECMNHFDDAIKKWSHKSSGYVKDVSHNVMEYDDFYNEGMMCLMEVYKRYKPINTFNTNLHKSLDNLQIDLMRMINAQKRRTDYTVVSFDKELEDGDLLSDIEGDIDKNFSQMEFNEDISNALSKLTNEERKIVEFLINDESTKKVLAKQLGISRPTLDTRIIKVKDKVIDLLPEYITY